MPGTGAYQGRLLEASYTLNLGHDDSYRYFRAEFSQGTSKVASAASRFGAARRSNPCCATVAQEPLYHDEEKANLSRLSIGGKDCRPSRN